MVERRGGKEGNLYVSVACHNALPVLVHCERLETLPLSLHHMGAWQATLLAVVCEE